MFKTIKSLFILLIFATLSFGYDKLQVSSNSFKNGQYLPIKYTCDGENISPNINWKNFPRNTKSFVLITVDPDAPIGTFTHWIVYNIPKSINSLPESFPKRANVNGINQGINDFGYIGYGGACPPKGDKPHRYYFKVYALDIEKIDLPPQTANRRNIEKAIKGHILGEGYIMGYYKR